MRNALTLLACLSVQKRIFENFNSIIRAVIAVWSTYSPWYINRVLSWYTVHDTGFLHVRIITLKMAESDGNTAERPRQWLKIYTAGLWRKWKNKTEENAVSIGTRSGLSRRTRRLFFAGGNGCRDYSSVWHGRTTHVATVRIGENIFPGLTLNKGCVGCVAVVYRVRFKAI